MRHFAIALELKVARSGKSFYMATLAEKLDSMHRNAREGRIGLRVRSFSSSSQQADHRRDRPYADRLGRRQTIPPNRQ